MRPSLVTGNGQQTQAPPPYYAENKALEHSLDHALAMEDSKSPAYGQTGYGYHQPNHNINGENNGNFRICLTNPLLLCCMSDTYTNCAVIGTSIHDDKLILTPWDE